MSGRSERLTPNLVFVGSFVALCAFWLLWWAALYPGVLSPDSIDQWEQARSFQFNSWHPYLYALILSGLGRLWNSPSTMGLLQVFVTALLISWIGRYALVSGVRIRWVLLCVAVYALHPQFGVYNSTIWKDVLFSTLLVAEAFLLYQVAAQRVEAWQPYVLLGVLAGVSVSLRVNGIINLVLPAALLLFSAVRRRWIVFMIVSALLGQVFFGVLLSRAVHVVPARFQMDQIRVKTVGAIYRLSRPAPSLSSEEAAVFESMMSRDLWYSAYSPSYSNELFFQHFLKLPEVQDLTVENLNQSGFYAEWKRAVVGAAIRNPGAIVRDKYLQFLYFAISRDVPLMNVNSVEIYGPKLREQAYPYLSAVLPSPRIPRLRAWCIQVIDVSSGGLILGQLLWAPGWGVIAYLAMLVYAALKKYTATVLYISFVLLNVVFVIVISPASDYRFLYFATLALFVTPLLLAAEAQGIDRQVSARSSQ